MSYINKEQAEILKKMFNLTDKDISKINTYEAMCRYKTNKI